MNTFLLDTCVLLWTLQGNMEKIKKFIPILSNEKNIIYVSVASYWEIMIKKSLGRIEVEDNLASAIEESGFLWLNIKLPHIDHIATLPKIHNDPFDRLLIAQALCEDMEIITTDDAILDYTSTHKTKASN